MAQIGIDLGTRFSRVAIYRNNRAEVIADDNGRKTTPCIVSFCNNQRLIGDKAKQQLGINPANTIYGIKRLIGRRFDDKTMQDDIKQWPFEVIDDNNRPNIKVTVPDKTIYLHPEEISAMILERMKIIAEQYLGEKVAGAVITVPAYFSYGQRQATKQAAKIAELNVLRIINEPAAAAIAYGLHNKVNTEKPHENGSQFQKVVVFDFGGDTLNVTVLVVGDGVLDVKATNGDTQLGGEDFDNRVVVHCLQNIKQKHHIDLSKNKTALAKLKTHCEEATRTLLQAPTANIHIEALIDGADFSITITRKYFDMITEELIGKVIAPVIVALKEAKFDSSEIHNVVLVGGSTRILQIQSALQKLFPHSMINKDINPDEVVAMGAAIQAAKLGGTGQSEVLMDVIPLSLGIQVAGGKMSIIIPRNTPIPVTKKKIFTTNKYRQTTVNVQLYEGERPFTANNNFLGEFKLTGITPAPVGVAQIEVSFHLNSDGVLSCTAVECNKDKKGKEIIVKSKAGILTPEEIKDTIERAKVLRLEDEREKERVDARLNLQTLCTNLNSCMLSSENYGKDSNLRNKVMYLCGLTQSWIYDNLGLPKDDYVKKYKELRSDYEPIRKELLDNDVRQCQD